MSAALDNTILATATVNISKTMVSIEGVTYPVKGICGVFIKRPRIVGLALLALALGAMGASDLAHGSDGGLVLLAVSAVVLAFALTQPCVLVLRSASRDQKALHSRNRAELLTVKRAIEEAVTRRG